MNQPAARNMVFVSHANPEDNELTLWLSLQLANAGYAVWCDLTKLLGGEKFWEDIQQAIQNRTVKFVFILSRSSNQKRGTLDELDCAIGTEKRSHLRDFIITAKTDDLPFDEVYISIRRLNHIDFTAWPRGLATLIEKLEKDEVTRTPNFNPDAVCSWWRDQYSSDAGITNRPEKLLSNWFKVENLPTILHEHKITALAPGPFDSDKVEFPFPAVWVSELSFLTFAKAHDFSATFGAHLIIGESKEHSYEYVLAGRAVTDGVKHISQLLRTAWENALKTRLSSYGIANKQRCFYFPGDLVKDDFVEFFTLDGQQTWRGVVGFKTLAKGRLRHWHYGITGKPIMRPETLFVVKGHVLFSDDRKALWDSKDATAKARRNQCKNWWNDDWRDRLLATMSFLAGDEERIRIALGSEESFTLQTFPILFESPVSYMTPKELEKAEIDDYILEEEDDEALEE